MDDGKDVRAIIGGAGDRAAVDVPLGDDPGKPIARRGIRGGALGSGLGNRNFGNPGAYRHCVAVAVGSRAQPAGLRMRWLAWPGASWALWCISEVSRLQPQRKRA